MEQVAVGRARVTSSALEEFSLLPPKATIIVLAFFRPMVSQLRIPSLSALTQPSLDPSSGRTAGRFWLALSLGFGLFYSCLALRQAFASPLIVQDDARQHVFWMQRFLDPDLFPDDLIADYFQSVAPAGYRMLYQAAAMLGVEPFTFAKLLPLPITLVVTLYCFRLTLALLPVPFAAFTSTILLNQALWVNSDVASATPRAFVYPVLTAFLFYLVRGALLPCVLTLVLQGLFYPQALLLSLGVLGLRFLDWRLDRPPQQRLTWAHRSQRRFCAIAMACAVVVLVVYVLQSSAYGPTITEKAARQLPEFWPGGRSSFFSNDFWDYWLRGRSGMVHRKLFTPATQALGLLLPVYWGVRPLWGGKLRPRLLDQCQNLGILGQLSAVSIGMFFCAHAVLFKLHLPSRYVQHSLRIVLAVAAAIVLTSWLNALSHRLWLTNKTWQQLGRSGGAATLALFLLASIVLYPMTLKRFLSPGYLAAESPSVYQFLAQQPKNSRVASLSRMGDNIGSFAARSVLVSREHSIPYHWGYYRPLRDRIERLIRVQHSPDLAVVQRFIRDEGVTLWLLDSQSFDPEALAADDWLRQYQPETDTAVNRLRQGEAIALANPGLQERCSIYNQEGVVILAADCLLQQPAGSSQRQGA